MIIGATGLTGNCLLRLLLNDGRYNKVLALSRRSIDILHGKLEVEMVDFNRLKDYKPGIQVDEVYCCIGTTKSKTPNENAYRKVDFEIPFHAAKMARTNGLTTFVVMSSMGANPKSKVFYSRLKGEMEEAVKEQGILHTIIVRPSLIAGDRDEKRLGESLMKGLMTFINPFLIGVLKPYRSIRPEAIARAMIYLSNSSSGVLTVPSDQLQYMADDTFRD